MKCRGAPAGYTLVEVVVALVVLTSGAIALAAGSAVIVREMHAGSLRSEAGRLAASRFEIVRSGCQWARSGTETRGPITSEWTVAPVDSISVRLAGTVSYGSPRGSRTHMYSTVVACE